MISVPLPQTGTNRVRMMPPGRPTARSRSVQARADMLFDEVFIDLAHNHVARGLLGLLTGLSEIRRQADKQQWRAISDQRWPRHPLSTQFRDPQVRLAVMRVGGPRAGLAALLSLLGERPLCTHAPPR